MCTYAIAHQVFVLWRNLNSRNKPGSLNCPDPEKNDTA